MFRRKPKTPIVEAERDTTNQEQLREQRVIAVYHDASWEPPEYAGNPFILALPPYHERDTIIKTMREKIKVTHLESSRKLAKSAKLLCINRISNNFAMLPGHIRVFDWGQSQLRAHYHRHFEEYDPCRISEAYVKMQSGEFDVVSLIGSAHSRALFVVGCSGVGKTTAARIGLSTCPNIIAHENFKGKGFRVVQVVWILITVPHNGSIDAMCRSILQWFDLRLGTRYVNEMRKRGVNSADWVEKVVVVLKHHHVGLVVIDEIQNALRAADRTSMLDMLVNFLNGNACAVIAIGTPEAESILNKRFRLGRRGGSEVIHLNPFAEGTVKDYENRELTIEERALLQILQDRDRYLRIVTAIDFSPTPMRDVDGVCDMLMKVSAGLPAFINLAWALTQYEAVAGGHEMITPELLESTTQRWFVLVAPLLKALREKDLKTINRVGDMAVRRLSNELRDRLSEEDRALLQSVQEDDEKAAVFAHVVSTLIDLGIGAVKAERVVTALQREAPGLNAAQLTSRALNRVYGPDAVASAVASKDAHPEEDVAV
jgi:AAA domain